MSREMPKKIEPVKDFEIRKNYNAPVEKFNYFITEKGKNLLKFIRMIRCGINSHDMRELAPLGVKQCRWCPKKG